jgi:hypothetical protein
MKDNITIVTGASSNHFNCLKNLLWSVSTFTPEIHTVVYDLGLTRLEASQIVNIRKFDFSKYPSYFAIKDNSGRMGFRPVTVQQAAQEFGGIVIWLDAGCLITGEISELITQIKKDGVYCHRTFGTIGTTLHPTAKASLNVSDAIAQIRIRDAGIAGFDTTNSKAMDLINKWAAVAVDKGSTAPDGSSKKNHRQDAVFSVLLEQAGFAESRRIHNIKMRQDNMPLALSQRIYQRFKF